MNFRVTGNIHCFMIFRMFTTVTTSLDNEILSLRHSFQPFLCEEHLTVWKFILTNPWY